MNYSKKKINYSLDELRALLALHRLQSFVRAASALHITQPALTRRLQLLEEAVGGRLVDRSTRAMRFTPLGEWLVARVRDEVEGLDRHLGLAAQMARGEVGTLEFACLTTVAYAIAPRVVAQFHQAHPQVRVALLDDTGMRVIESVRSGRAEFGVGIWSQELEDIEAQVVCRDPFVLAMPPEHPLGRRRRIRWKELEGAQVVALRNTSENRRQIDAALHAHGVAPPWFDEVEHLSSLLGWLHTGHGMGVIPQLAMQTAEARSLRCVPLVEPAIDRKIALLKRPGASLSGPARLLWDLFARALGPR